jgi:hypothetical protein
LRRLRSSITAVRHDAHGIAEAAVAVVRRLLAGSRLSPPAICSRHGSCWANRVAVSHSERTSRGERWDDRSPTGPRPTMGSCRWQPKRQPFGPLHDHRSADKSRYKNRPELLIVGIPYPR